MVTRPFRDAGYPFHATHVSRREAQKRTEGPLPFRQGPTPLVLTPLPGLSEKCPKLHLRSNSDSCGVRFNGKHSMLPVTIFSKRPVRTISDNLGKGVNGNGVGLSLSKQRDPLLSPRHLGIGKWVFSATRWLWSTFGHHTGTKQRPKSNRWLPTGDQQLDTHLKIPFCNGQIHSLRIIRSFLV